MTKKVTKYYVTGTEDEVQLNDVVEIVLVKEGKKGRKLHRVETVEVTETSIPYLLDMEVLEEREVEVEVDEDDDLLDFEDEEDDDICPFKEFIEDFNDYREAVAEDIEELDKRMEVVEAVLHKLQNKLNHKKSTDKKVEVK